MNKIKDWFKSVDWRAVGKLCKPISVAFGIMATVIGLGASAVDLKDAIDESKKES